MLFQKILVRLSILRSLVPPFLLVVLHARSTLVGVETAPTTMKNRFNKVTFRGHQFEPCTPSIHTVVPADAHRG